MARRFKRRTSRDAYRRVALHCPFCGRENFLTSSGLRDHKEKCKSVPTSGRRQSHPIRYEDYKKRMDREWEKRSVKRRALPAKSTDGFEAWRSGGTGKKKAKAEARLRAADRRQELKHRREGRRLEKAKRYGKDRTLGSGNWSQRKVRRTTSYWRAEFRLPGERRAMHKATIQATSREAAERMAIRKFGLDPVDAQYLDVSPAS